MNKESDKGTPFERAVKQFKIHRVLFRIPAAINPSANPALTKLIAKSDLKS